MATFRVKFILASGVAIYPHYVVFDADDTCDLAEQIMEYQEDMEDDNIYILEKEITEI